MLVTNDDVTLFRNAVHLISPRVLNVVPRTVVARATIAASPSSNPISTLTVSWTEGDASDVEEGQLVFIGTTAGAYDVAVTVLRDGSSGTTLAVSGQSQGDSGTPRARGNILKALAVGQHVTIIRHYPIWAALSRLSEGKFYKKFNKAYAGELLSLDPIANLGPWEQAFVDPIRNLARFTLSAASSFAWQAKVIAQWQWSLDGGTVVSGTLTSETLEADFPPGFYIVTCQVIDTGGRSHKGRKYIWVNTYTGEHAPFNVRYDMDVNQIKQTRRGGEMSITLYDDMHAEEIYPYVGVLYTERGLYDGQEAAYTGRFRAFVGYLGSISQAMSRTRTQREYVIQSPLLRAASLPNPPQQFTESPLPASWNEMSVSNPGSATWYELYWHVPALIANHDFIMAGDYAQLRKQSFVWQGEGVGQHLAEIEQLYLGNVGSLADGTTLLSAGPLHREQDYRNAMPTVYRWSTRDISKDALTIPLTVDEPNAFTIGYSFAYNGGKEAVPYGAIAPGRTQGQGLGKPTMATFIVPAEDGQYITQRIVAHEHARQSADIKAVTLKISRNIDIADPADLRAWHELDFSKLILALGYLPRALPLTVTRTYRRGGVKSITAEFELETYSEIAGEILPVLRGGGSGWVPGGWVLNIPDFFDPTPPDFDIPELNNGKVIVRTDQNHIARTTNFLDRVPHWERISDALIPAGVLHDIALGPSGILWAACWKAETNTASVYVCSLPWATTVDWSLNHSWTISDADGGLKLKLGFDPGTLYPYGVSWHTPNGAFVIRARTLGEALSTRPTEHIATGTSSTGKRAGSGRNSTRYLLPGRVGDDYELLFANAGAGFTQVAGRPGDGNSEPSATLNPITDNRFFVTVDIVDDTPASSTYHETDAFEAITLPGGDSLYQSSLDPDAINKSVYYGYLQAFRLTPEGQTMTVTAFTGQIAVSQAFNTIQTTGPQVRGRIFLMDKTYQTLWTSDFIQFDSIAGAGAVYFPNFAGYEVVVYGKAGTITHTFSTPLEGVMYVGMELRSVDKLVRSAVYRPGFPSTPYEEFATGAEFDLTVNNIRTEGRRLYSLYSPFAAPVWTDITPSGLWVPDREYGAHADPADAGLMVLAGKDFKGRRALLTSDNGGAGWVRRQEEFYTGALRYGSAVIAFGFTRLELSDDKGVTMFSRLGDYVRQVGNVGTIEQVIVI